MTSSSKWIPFSPSFRVNNPTKKKTKRFKTMSSDCFTTDLSSTPLNWVEIENKIPNHQVLRQIFLNEALLHGDEADIYLKVTGYHGGLKDCNQAAMNAYDRICTSVYSNIHILYNTSSTAQGGGGSFKIGNL